MPVSSVPSRRRARPSGVVAAAVVAVVAPVLAGCSGGAAGGPSALGVSAGPVASVPPAVATPAVRAAPTRTRASAVLHRWDQARAEAFAAGDLDALQRLYVPGSAAGTADARTLGAYLERGLHVEGMRMQLLAVEVLQERPGRIRLQVTDRLAGAVAVGPRGRVQLPSDAASTRGVELVRGDAGWQVASVSAPGST